MRMAYVVLVPAIVLVALAALPDLLPFWLIPVGWAFGGLGIGLGYAAHSQLTLRCAPEHEYGAATSSLQLLDNLGVALGTGAVGVVVTLGDDLGWAAGDAVALALGVTATVAAIGLLVSRRLPAGRPTAVEVTLRSPPRSPSPTDWPDPSTLCTCGRNSAACAKSSRKRPCAADQRWWGWRVGRRPAAWAR